MTFREIIVKYDPEDKTKGVGNYREKSSFDIAMKDVAALREAADTIEHFATSDKAKGEIT